jgi:multiple sugar transport system permease protein
MRRNDKMTIKRTYQYFLNFFARRILPRLLLLLLSFLFLLPFYWMLTAAVKNDAELRMVPPTLYPHEPHFENFLIAIQYIDFFRFLMNTMIIAAGCVTGAIIINSLVSYGLSRIEWKGRTVLFYLIIATMFIPFPVVLVGLFDIFAKLRLVNTWAPLILPSWVGNAVLIFMMRQYLMGLPKEISDAGFVDGANELQIFGRLILPLMKPAVGVTAIFTALWSWNDFMGPLIYLSREDLYPLSLGLQFYRSTHQVEYSMLMAASCLVVLPVVVIFLIFQRFFVEGITMGAIKG